MIRRLRTAVLIAALGVGVAGARPASAVTVAPQQPQAGSNCVWAAVIGWCMPSPLFQLPKL